MSVSSAVSGNPSHASSATQRTAAPGLFARSLEARWLLRALLAGGVALAVAALLFVAWHEHRRDTFVGQTR